MGSGKAYLDHLSPNTRQQICRSIRLYAREGKLVAQRARDVPEALRFLEELKELHQRTWTRRGETGSFAFPFFERFQRRLIATCLPRGTVEIIRVTCGERVIGYLYNFVWRGTVLAYQSGLAYEADARLKPGLVAHCLAIDIHLAEGAMIYDFMAGEARYKASLGLGASARVRAPEPEACPRAELEDRLAVGAGLVRARQVAPARSAERNTGKSVRQIN